MATSELFGRLKALGAGEFAHFNGSLEEHLIGTEALLRRWRCAEHVCIAGLFHAAYGTAGYGEQLVSIELRDKVTALIGHEAESLVYLYCACDRDAFFPRIGSLDQLHMPNRFTQQEQALSLAELEAFCVLTMANEMQIAAASSEFRTQHGAALAELFGRMSGLVEKANLSEALAVLGNT